MTPEQVADLALKTERDFVWVCPGRQGGTPCVGGTRIPVEVVARYMLALGFAETVAAYPHLDRGAVLTACWYVVRYGPKKWRRRWGDWADEHRVAMWKGDWDEVPDPPRREGPTA